MIVESIFLCEASPHFPGPVSSDVSTIVYFNIVDPFSINWRESFGNIVFLQDGAYAIFSEFFSLDLSSFGSFIGLGWVNSSLLVGRMVFVMSHSINSSSKSLSNSVLPVGNVLPHALRSPWFRL